MLFTQNDLLLFDRYLAIFTDKCARSTNFGERDVCLQVRRAAKSISAKNHQDLYRTARHWRCIFAVYIGRRYVIDLSQIGIRNHLARLRLLV